MRNKRKLLIVVLSFALMGCTNQQKYMYPRDVAEEFVQASFRGDYEEVNKCYGEKVIRQKAENGANLRFRYFAVADAEDLKIKGVEELLKEGPWSFIGISYELRMKDGKTVPQYEYLMLKREEGRYHIMLSGQWTEKVREKVERHSTEIEETKLYQEYAAKLDAFNQEYPEYLTQLYDSAKTAELSFTRINKDKQIKRIEILVLIVTVIQAAVMGILAVTVKMARKRGDF